jgi:RNA polymerase sigma-70 factor (ECF subfamily)
MEQPATRPSLLLRVRDPGDEGAWRDFVALYGALIYRFARKRGLQEADADDLTQIVFQNLALSLRALDFDPRRGSFRSWLYAVVRHQLANYVHRQARGTRGSGDTDVQAVLENLPQQTTDEQALWDEEYERSVFRWAAERVRGGFQESSWQAFWQTAVEGKAAREVAGALKTTVGAVYTAKSRVLDAIKRVVQELQDSQDWPGGPG